LLTLTRAAASRTLKPRLSRVRARASLSSVTTGLRPPLRPRAVAAARPLHCLLEQVSSRAWWRRSFQDYPATDIHRLLLVEPGVGPFCIRDPMRMAGSTREPLLSRCGHASMRPRRARCAKSDHASFKQPWIEVASSRPALRAEALLSAAAPLGPRAYSKRDKADNRNSSSAFASDILL
jgi:hypothetical protein